MVNYKLIYRLVDDKKYINSLSTFDNNNLVYYKDLPKQLLLTQYFTTLQNE